MNIFSEANYSRPVTALNHSKLFCSVILLVVGLPAVLNAQSAIGITGQPDTSYSTYSAYINTKKTHPDIRIAEELHTDDIKELKDIVYCNVSDRKLLLDVFSPANKNRNSGIAVMIIHGGGWRTGNRTQHYPMAQRLAQLGYTCFTAEYRLSTEALYPAAVHDLKAAIKWIRAHAHKYAINEDKIVVAGFSAGGELAAFLGTTNDNQKFEGTGCETGMSANVQAIIDIDGTLSFVHPESGEGDDSKRTSAATYWFGYSKADNPELWKEASPLIHAGSHTPPTLFLNSSVERMHAGRNDYVKILNQYNIYTEVRVFEGAPHSFCLFHPWFEPTVSYIDEFLKKVFKK